jgi:hypothetical protein
MFGGGTVLELDDVGERWRQAGAADLQLDWRRAETVAEMIDTATEEPVRPGMVAVQQTARSDLGWSPLSSASTRLMTEGSGRDPRKAIHYPLPGQPHPPPKDHSRSGTSRL